MQTGLIIELTYKASHHVSRLDHPVHSHSHFHTWTVQLKVAGFTDAHNIQQWMHETAPHFADHGDKGVEDIAAWWVELAQKRFDEGPEGLRVLGVSLMREDGIGAFVDA
ncbi:MAG: hypothetical protein KDB07_04190 [Planctomycetes bacterium]|nr:hypothetical protein [Planctomycetota bacterium]